MVFCEVQVGNSQSLQTRSNVLTARPLWDERLLFDVKRANDIAEVRVYGDSGLAGRSLIGKWNYPLEVLAALEESKFDDWVDIKDGARVTGKIKVSVTLVGNEVQSLNEKIKASQGAIEKSNEVLRDIQEALNFIHTAFDFPKELPVHPDTTKGSPTKFSPEKIHKYLPTWRLVEDGLDKAQDNLGVYVDEYAPKISGIVGLDKAGWAKISQYGSMIFIVLTTLVAFGKPDFLNVNFLFVSIISFCWQYCAGI